MRLWTNRADDNGSVHAMGNGRMVVYGQGPDLIDLYGPPHSSPNILTLVTECDQPLTDSASRETGTAVWRHEMKIGDAPALEFTEFVASGSDAYVRLFKCREKGVRWVIHGNPAAEFVPSHSIPNAWVQVILPGQRIFNYPSALTSNHIIIPQGSCRIVRKSEHELAIEIEPGEGSLVIVGDTELPEAISCAEKIAKAGAQSLFVSTLDSWRKFTERRVTAKPALNTLPPEIAEALDGAAVLIKVQQSEDGGVMAGHRFALAYVRDQYGTARGMLALGMLEEARLNLSFRLGKFERFGSLMTAEAMGTDCCRHNHENDEVEGPAYTILQTRDYLRATHDLGFARKLWPMLAWCWRVQKKHLAGGLLPFNGDETYVAGGFFPRSGLEQGSADSTLAFIEAGKWLADFAIAQSFWTKATATKELRFVEQARKAYRLHFFDEDRIWANEPEREKMTAPRRFRHGVCEGRCGFYQGLGWTERSQNGRYLCPKCLAEKDLPPEHPAKMEVNSVGLLPAYIGSDILTKAELRRVMDHVLSQAGPTGHIPSVPGTVGCVGYDPGLVLIGLVACKHPAAKLATDRLIRILDPAGAWVEYYGEDDGPRAGCCRCRPWETGVNAAAVVEAMSNWD